MREASAQRRRSCRWFSTVTAMSRRNCAKSLHTSSSMPAVRFRPMATIPTALCAPPSRSASTISTSSDGAAFVQGIAQFDAEARARGVVVLSGVSSFPVLTAAVVRRLARGMARVDTVIGGIAPSPYANVGINVIRAITSYAGKPVAMIRDGRPAIGYALIDARRYTIAPPGPIAAPSDPVLAGRCSGPPGAAGPVAEPSPGVDGGRAGAGDLASHSQCAGLDGAPETAAIPAAIRRPDVPRDQCASPGANIAAACSSRSRGLMPPAIRSSGPGT